MVEHVGALQELPSEMEALEMAGVLGCCALASVGTCPGNTLDSLFCQTPSED